MHYFNGVPWYAEHWSWRRYTLKKRIKDPNSFHVSLISIIQNEHRIILFGFQTTTENTETKMVSHVAFKMVSHVAFKMVSHVAFKMVSHVAFKMVSHVAFHSFHMQYFLNKNINEY